MAKHSIDNIEWREVAWQRPFNEDNVYEMLTHLATIEGRGPIIWESRSHKGYVKNIIGADRKYMNKIAEAIKIHGDIAIYPLPAHTRVPMRVARKVSITKPSLALNTNVMTSTVRAGLAALANVRGEDSAVLQIVLGGSYAPTIVPKTFPDPHASWLQTIFGSTEQITNEARKSIKEKSEQHCFQALIRIGSSGEYARGNINGVLSALRTLESAGVRIYTDSEKNQNLNMAHVPWHFPLRLSVKEVASFLMLPVGDEELPGTNGLHPKTTLPPSWYREPTNRMNDRTFAMSKDGINSKKLSISPKDGLEHTILLGPTGSGKSTAMQNLILSDIYAGRSVLVIDPKADLVNSILERIPESRYNDVVVIDPSDPCPVGFNPLSLPGNPVLIADAILAVFKEIFAENWGIRSQDVLSAALLTLAEVKGSSLLWLPQLLTDENFRHSLTDKIKDQIALKPFWNSYDNMRDSERKQEIAPVLNKIRQFLYRPGLRAILGQSEPKFQLTDLFYKRKIVLVPLNKGTVGAESAKLLGSLIVGLTWTLTLSRANIPAEKRHIISLYIDELQDYLSLPTDLADALAQARGLGVSITMAHQYRAQLPPELKAGIDANARNKIIFGLNSSDAKEVAAMAPNLEALDFMTLPRYEVYTNVMSDGKSTGWIHGKTIPPPASLKNPAELRALSQTTYGRPIEEVEEEFLELLRRSDETPAPEATQAPIGRRKI